MPRHATSTSFKKGHVWTVVSKAKRLATLQRQKEEGVWVNPSLGIKQSKESIQRRAISRRKKAIGNRYKHKASPDLYYWQVMTENGRRYEHRIIMERHLGRPLLKQEHVHHINHDTLDNRIENLQLLTHSEHSRLHSKERSKEFIEMFKNSSKLPTGKWARNYDSCIECYTTKCKYGAKGRCRNCFCKEQRRVHKIETVNV